LDESDGIDDKFDYVKIRNEAENLPECPPQRDRPLSDPPRPVHELGDDPIEDGYLRLVDARHGSHANFTRL
jgi:hypothetical protein